MEVNIETDFIYMWVNLGHTVCYIQLLVKALCCHSFT